MPSFKVPCLSCENPVLIKDPKLIGTKVECPKCKYRFKVEEPAGGIPTEDAKPGKAKKPADEGDEGGKKKKKSKKLVAIVVGVLAVGVLAAVGFAVMGGGDKPKPMGGVTKGGGGGSAGIAGTTNTSQDPNEDPNKKDSPKELQRKNALAFSDREPTNLLPGQTVSLYRFDLEKLRQTPINTLFDPLMLGMFKDSFGFDADDVALYYHAFVGNTRAPFGVIRLKEPILEKDLLSKMALADGPKTVKGRTLHTFKTNPFINGIANAFSLGSLFSQVYEKVPPSPVTSPESRVIGICAYDLQHILVGDRALLESYLNDLDTTGYPKFLSSRTADSALPLAENPLYLSIDPKLKKFLKELGSESSSPPAVLYGEKLVQGLYAPTLFKSEFQPIAAMLDPILNRTVYLGANLLTFTPKQATGTVRIEMLSSEYALEVVKAQLTPGLMFATQAISLFLGSPVEFRNQALGVIAPTLGNPGPGMGFGPGSPGMGPGFSGQPGMGSAYGPKQGSGQGPGPMRPGSGPGMGPPGMGPGFPGQPGMGPGFPGQPGMGSAYGPGKMGTPGASTGSQTPNGLPPSYIDLGLVDQSITVKIDIHWSDEAYSRFVAPHMFSFVNTIKGKMAVYASDMSYHGLAMAVPKLTKEFPRGTADRKPTDASRMGLKYPPDTRVSLFAELLPYMGRGRLAGSIDRQLAWYDEKNLPAAEAWVPEFLVPYYPQSAWRATSRFVTDGRSLGGTNYVAIAGIGNDAARLNPANPADAKRVGLVGYDWGSKPEQVTDGLSNTIFLMQTPPGISQPWIQGGGATVRGLNEKDPMQGFRHTTPNGQQGTYALMGDGSVRFISGNINPAILRAMSTRAGGEEILTEVLDKEAPRVDQPKKVEAELKTDPKPIAPIPPDTKVANPKKSDDPPTPLKKETPVTPKGPISGPKLEVAPEPRVKP